MRNSRTVVYIPRWRNLCSQSLSYIIYIPTHHQPLPDNPRGPFIRSCYFVVYGFYGTNSLCSLYKLCQYVYNIGVGMYIYSSVTRPTHIVVQSIYIKYYVNLFTTNGYINVYIRQSGVVPTYIQVPNFGGQSFMAKSRFNQFNKSYRL